MGDSHSEGRRYQWEYQGGKKQKDEEGYGCLDVIQNDAAMPKNRGVH